MPALRNAQARTVAHAGRNPHGDRLGPHRTALATARGTPSLPLAPCAAAGGAGLREDHVPARPPHLPRPLALRAPHVGRRNLAGPATGRAWYLPRHRHLPLDTAQRVAKRQAQRRVQIGARLRTPLGSRYRVQHFGKKLRERRRLRALHRGGEIEAGEFECLALAAGSRSFRRCRNGSGDPDPRASRRLPRFAETALPPGGHPG